MEWLRRDPAELDLPAVQDEFLTHGYARLGVWASEAALVLLRRRLDDIVLGRVDHRPFYFQHDSATGAYEDLPRRQGWQGPSPNYRKIEKLERDEVFLAWLQNRLFERIARHFIGGPVSLYRALVFNKGPAGGSVLPWHQDGGPYWGVAPEPYLQIWTALDAAPVEAGCVEVIDASHTRGIATAHGGLVPQAMVDELTAVTPIRQLPAAAGEVILIHNRLWHRSQRNHTTSARRAFSACLMSAETRCLRKRKAPRQFPLVFAG